MMLALFAATVHAAPVQITVTGMRNTDGMLRLFAYSSEEGFTVQPDKAQVRGAWPTQAGPQTVSIDLPPGTWAISLLHDEDGDGTLDTNFIGMPREGVGASVRPGHSRFGPPRFSDATFVMGDVPRVLTIKLAYLL